jgi:uncharacterized protein with FMN-binding domain
MPGANTNAAGQENDQGNNPEQEHPPVEATVPAAPAAAPLVELAAYNALKITWEATPGAGAYELYLGTSPESAEKKGGDVGGTTAVIEDLSPATEYYVRIRAKNSAGASGYSPVSAPTRTLQAPPESEPDAEQQEPDTEQEPSPEQEPPAPLEDDRYTAGTYTGAIPSIGGELTATAQFTADAIIAITVNHTDTRGIATEPMIATIIQRILDAQSADVDVVSGATITGARIKNAVEDCVEQALTTKPAKQTGIGHDFINNSGYPITIKIPGGILDLQPGDKKTVYSADGSVDFTPPISGTIITASETGRTIFYMRTN